MINRGDAPFVWTEKWRGRNAHHIHSQAPGWNLWLESHTVQSTRHRLTVYTWALTSVPYIGALSVFSPQGVTYTKAGAQSAAEAYWREYLK